jgi:hypothetical protein
MVHGTSLCIRYVIKVDKKLDKYNDINPINSKLRYDLSLRNGGNLINPNFNFRGDRFHPPIGLFYAIDYEYDCGVDERSSYRDLYKKRREDEYKERGTSVEMVEKYVDVLFYSMQMKALSEEKINEYLNMPIPEDNENIETEKARKIKRIMESKEYFEEIKMIEDEIVNKSVKLTLTEKELLIKIREELESRGVGVIGEYFEIYTEYY